MLYCKVCDHNKYCGGIVKCVAAESVLPQIDLDDDVLHGWMRSLAPRQYAQRSGQSN